MQAVAAMNGGDEPGIPCHRQEAGGRALQTSQNELRKGRGREPREKVPWKWREKKVFIRRRWSGVAFAARTELQCQPDRERVIGMLPRVRLGMCSSLGE